MGSVQSQGLRDLATETKDGACSSQLFLPFPWLLAYPSRNVHLQKRIGSHDCEQNSFICRSSQRSAASDYLVLKLNGKRSSSALLDLRPSEGLLDVSKGDVPVHLAEELVHVALLRHEKGALAVRDGLEKLQSQTSGAHFRSKPDPALAIVLDLLGLVDAVADASLGHEHGVLHLCDQALHSHGNVLLANVARGWALPQAGVALEALRRKLAVEELPGLDARQLRTNNLLGNFFMTQMIHGSTNFPPTNKGEGQNQISAQLHNQLGEHGALRRVTAISRQQ